MHRPNDPAANHLGDIAHDPSKDKQPPTNGGTAIFKMGVPRPLRLKFNLSCQ